MKVKINKADENTGKNYESGDTIYIQLSEAKGVDADFRKAEVITDYDSSGNIIGIEILELLPPVDISTFGPDIHFLGRFVIEYDRNRWQWPKFWWKSKNLGAIWRLDIGPVSIIR